REHLPMKSRAVLAALILFQVSVARAEPPGKTLRFERDIQPLLMRCVTCHGSEKARAGLRFDSREGAVALLGSGNQAVVPGNPAESELLRRVRSEDPVQRMPRKGERLTPAQVESLERWIADGAPWPAHWAYRPLTKPPLPGSNFSGRWERTPIDRFVQAE